MGTFQYAHQMEIWGHFCTILPPYDDPDYYISLLIILHFCLA